MKRPKTAVWMIALALVWTGCSRGDRKAGSEVVNPGDAPTSESTEARAEEASNDQVVPPVEWVVPVGPMDETFPVGPYLGHTTQTSVAISWESAEAGDSVVEYGLDETYSERIDAPETTLHQVVLTGLSPATTYHYRVCTSRVCTRDLTFATAPGPETRFRFSVYGDTRSDPVTHRKVVEGMLSRHPALVVNTGDIVSEGINRNEYREMHFEPLRQLGQYLPVYVSIGNHEWKGEVATQVPSFREYLMFPEDPGVPVPELSYSVRYGNAFFLVLDNTLDGWNFFSPIGEPPGPPLWVWLNQQVNSKEAQDAKWRFAFFHYPPGSPCHEDWGMIAATREHVLPLLRSHGFQAVFAGHVHAYERHDYDGFPVFTTGGGGAGLQSEDNCEFESTTLQLRRVIHHYLSVDLQEDAALIEAVDIDGEVFDSLRIDG